MSSFDVGVFDDRLDHQVGGDELVDGGDAREHLVRIGAAFLVQLRQRLLDVREPALDRARCGIVQRHAATGRGDDLRDAAAHLTGADDENVLEAP